MNKIKTLGSLYINNYVKFLNKPLFYKTPTTYYTYNDLHRLENKYAHLIADRFKHPVRKKIALILNNSIDWIAITQAAHKLDSTIIPINPKLNKQTQRHIIHQVKPDLIFYQNDYDKIVQHKETDINLNSINYKQIPDSFNYLNWDVTCEDSNAYILFTSGTTSNPKGVVLTHKNILANLESIQKCFPNYQLSPTDKYVSFLPWTHCYGLVCELKYMMTNGLSTYINKNPDNLITDFRTYKPELLCTVPKLLNKIYNKIHQNEIYRSAISICYNNKYYNRYFNNFFFGGNLKMVTVGGASIPEDVIKFYNKLGIQLYQGYGLTETSPMISLNYINNNNIGSVGKVLDCNEVYINEQNEIMVSGDNVFNGYYNQNNQNNQDIFEYINNKKYYRTGDSGRFDNDGYLYITGRIKELYKLENGKYIDPCYIEDRIQQFKGVEQVYVYGANRKYNICLIYGNKRMEKEILKNISNLWLMSYIEHYELPKKVIFIDEAFSIENDLLTVKMSLKREKIYEKYKNEIEQLYT
jgi:long-chain acyl-CoA synthetase